MVSFTREAGVGRCLLLGCRCVVSRRIGWDVGGEVRIKDKFFRKLNDVLPLVTLSLRVESPKAKGKYCRDFQNARKVLP
jgi:hypothetical protein